MRRIVFCLDTSESMGYGDPPKLEQAVGVVKRTMESSEKHAAVGLITFDVTANVLLELTPLDPEKVTGALERIIVKGVTCAAAGLTEGIKMLEKNRLKGEILFITDGRANLSLNRMGGFEGSIALEEELLRIGKGAGDNGVTVHTVAVGEDAFTHGLAKLSLATGGRHWLAEDFSRLDVEPVIAPKVLEVTGLRVHGAPVELPSAQPTWAKESQLVHVAVVSQALHGAYKVHNRAFLVNPVKTREARTALIPVESDWLADYRERRPKTARDVSAGDAILLDRSYRDYLALDEKTRVKLVIC